MRWRRFRLRSLMILVFLAALALGVFDRVRRVEQVDWHRVREVSFLVVPVALMVILKLSLSVSYRAKRPGITDRDQAEPGDPGLTSDRSF